MRKKIILLIFVMALTFVCSSACNTSESSYLLQSGTYGFENAVITNRTTKEITEKSFDDILHNKDDFKAWSNLLGFQIYIDENTEYYCTKDKTYFVCNEGLAFEIIGENALRLHFPSWSGYDFNSYDVTIFLCWKKTYG